MVIQPAFRPARQHGVFMTELMGAIALLVIAVMPIAYSVLKERSLARAYYQRAVAMEIVDGETEILAAGAWRKLPAGTHEYPVHAGSVTNLPPGHFWLTIETNKLRFEWKPEVKHRGGSVVREVTLK